MALTPWEDDDRDLFIIIIHDLFGDEGNGVIEFFNKRYSEVREVARKCCLKYPNNVVEIAAVREDVCVKFLVEFEDREQVLASV